MKHPSFHSTLTILLPLQASKPKYAHQHNIQIKTVFSKVSQMVTVRGNVQSEPIVWIRRKEQFTNSSAIHCCLLYARRLLRDKEFKVYRILISAIMSRISGLEREETLVKKWVKWIWAFFWPVPHSPHSPQQVNCTISWRVAGGLTKTCGSASTGAWESEKWGMGGTQVEDRSVSIWGSMPADILGGRAWGVEVWRWRWQNWMINWLYWLK